MVTDHIIDGKRCRFYRDGSIYISDDGTLAAMPKTKEILSLQTDTSGVVYVQHTWGHYVGIAKAVITCFCKPKPEDGKKYRIKHKDGNSANCCYKNLEWELAHYKHATTSEVNNSRHGENLIVHKDGTIWSENGTRYQVHDSHYDSDTDLWRCVEPFIKLSVGNNPYGKTVYVEELMKESGFVNGDDAAFTSPVILHSDMDFMNCSADNLEFVEETDQLYIDYQAKKKADKHQRDVGLNPGKRIP